MRLPTYSLESLRRVVVAALGLALMAQAAQISVRLWSLTRESTTPRGGARADQASLASPRRAHETVQDVVAAHLFGTAPESPAADSRSEVAQWVLSGTLQGPTPGSGAAIIGRSGAPAQYCAAGAPLPGGFTLTGVFADRVTIARLGQRLSVVFSRTLSGSMTTVAARDPVEMVPARAALSRAENPVIRAPLNQPPALLVLRPAPHVGEDGSYDGMRIQGSGNGRGLDTYGLRRNDVIKEVGGRPITSPEAARKALETLSVAGAVDVTVERDGALFSLRLSSGT